jgi:carbonic anhydrase/acetyltransferase-like protein (isoleucine patch superfamily)
VLRDDFGAIVVGDETAIEEGVLLHARPDESTRIGSRVTVGHGAMVHNASIHDGAVIGMRAVVSDYAEVGAGALIGEMSLVKHRQVVPAGKVAVGAPVRIVGDVDERHRMMTHTAKTLYVDLAKRYAQGALVELSRGEATSRS